MGSRKEKKRKEKKRKGKERKGKYTTFTRIFKIQDSQVLRKVAISL
jgi:hypothetical protein